MDLSVQSGAYSRFNIDTKIGKKKFEKLYHLWMINSTNRKIAKVGLKNDKDEALEYFLDQYKKMFLSNVENYIENYDEYLKS